MNRLDETEREAYLVQLLEAVETARPISTAKDNAIDRLQVELDVIKKEKSSLQTIQAQSFERIQSLEAELASLSGTRELKRELEETREKLHSALQNVEYFKSQLHSIGKSIGISVLPDIHSISYR